MATGRRILGGIRIGRRLPRWANGSVLAFALALIALGVTAGLRDTGLASFFLDPPAEIVAQVPARTLPLCGSGPRKTCVIDGDTFWLDGEKIRIADINTPETGSPSCAAEARLGHQAAERLSQILSSGGFSLAAADRDEDRYGRKLRVVMQGGTSIGNTLIAEGLAHPWQGRRLDWCAG
ncbi:thermonuclease family protein [Devosia sp. BK]|uniref:thermonuclease family protein n=1 Tax=Devosia sp. BK TaxID=2871706 RepID=UPI00293A3A1C|nr:thermonuclease family protein [Devosia sp. BK]MDV3250377.1 thermonuclease family protein [Devosia sp. BK]